MGIVFAELKGRGILRERVQIHTEEIHRKLTVDVVEFVFAFSTEFLKVFLINFLQVMQVVGALEVHAFMDGEVLAVFFRDEGMPAMGAEESYRGGNLFTGNKSLSTDFTQELPMAAIIVVNVVVRGPAKRTDGIIRDGFAIPALNWLHRLAVFPLVVFEEELPVLFDKGFDNGECIRLKLLVFRRVGVIKSPLLKRDISADEVNQPAILLIKVLNSFK